MYVGDLEMLSDHSEHVTLCGRHERATFTIRTIKSSRKQNPTTTKYPEPKDNAVPLSVLREASVNVQVGRSRNVYHCTQKSPLRAEFAS